MSLNYKNYLGKFLLVVMTFVSSNSGYSNTLNWEDAQWIWQDQAGPANTWMSFRKTVIINEIPDAVEAQIAVDSKFWLWVNGELVIFEGGLSRGPSQAGDWNRKEKITPTNSW
ncbi:hypothetical protein [Algibacter sp.]|uniref:hypothetical protein n=1 Tax=Algibacter sp. TaxID=1872428 RepID=UPI003C70FEF1